MQTEQRKPGVSVGNWMWSQFLFSIPVVNLIMLIVWAITSPNRTKRNYCIAALVWAAILVVLAAASVVFFGGQIAAWLRGLNEQLTAL